MWSRQKHRELIKAAYAADIAFEQALQAAGMDRWEMPHSEYTEPVRHAYLRKLRADAAAHTSEALWAEQKARAAA